MFISEIQYDIRAIEDDAALYDETNFDNRANAIDFIDFHIIDRIEGLLLNAEFKEQLNTLKQRAETIQRELKKIDTNLFIQLRKKISSGIYTKLSFTEMICKYIGYDVSDISEPDKIGYDNLDIFINGLLANQAIPNTTINREPEMVFYQKTPARIIFKLARLAKLKEDDVFFDIGSGLGQVAILVNLIIGATAKGIEYEPAYCDYANACVLKLNLSNVEFINADALKGDYSQGTIFFLYTPFEGSMLKNMLEILQKESLLRTIRIFTYGPCSPHVAWQSWLTCVNGNADNIYKLYEFISLSTSSMV
jgi:SAM-dependent methyltransferase